MKLFGVLELKIHNFSSIFSHKIITEFGLYKMNKLLVAICMLFVVVCVVEARQCRYTLTYMLCEKQCCGEEGDMKCIESCENSSCSTDDDCGKSCCKNGKCGPPQSTSCSKPVSRDVAKSIIIAVVVSLAVVIAITVGAVLLAKYCCYTRPTPGMVILVNQ